jgi:hypothetical protein
MQPLEVSGAVRPLYGSLGVKGLMFVVFILEGILLLLNFTV